MQASEESKIDNVTDALKQVIKNARAVDGVVKGLNQVGKSLDRQDCFLCVLATDCDDPKYIKLITALAKQSKIPLIEVESRLQLGEWVGQSKYDKDGKPRSTKGCSSAAILNYGEASAHLTYLENHIKENNL